MNNKNFDYRPDSSPSRAREDVANKMNVALLYELRALASTVRQCQRNGHPDLSKHLNELLTKLGA